MFGVFKKRWKPKRNEKMNTSIKNRSNHMVLSTAASCNIYTEPMPITIIQNENINKTRIHLNDEELQSIANTNINNTKEESIKYLEDSDSSGNIHNIHNNHNIDNAIVPIQIQIPNICVEDGRIEFIKNNTSHYEYQITEKDIIDHNKEEYMQTRIMELEKALETEKKIVQREKLTCSRLQRQLTRRELLQRDVDRERRLRLDSENRLHRSESDTERCRAKLAVLQREFIRMEDTVRSMLQYKTKYEQVKQEKTSLAIACENHIQHFQRIIQKMKDENEELKSQLQHFEFQYTRNNLNGKNNNNDDEDDDVQNVLLSTIETLQMENNALKDDLQIQRKQYDKCLDDVANQVVKALLNQKNLQEEVNSLQDRVKNLNTCNKTLSCLLLQQINNNNNSKTDEGNTATCYKKGMTSTWIRKLRPHSLNIENISLITSDNDNIKRQSDESPESGNRDEGYSTMSSDVQATTNCEIPNNTQILPQNEVDDDDDGVNNSHTNINDNIKHQLFKINNNNQIIRSFSDSQLSLKISRRIEFPFRLSHTRVSSLIEISKRYEEPEMEDGFSFCSSDLVDSDYIQHWLQLDDTRSVIQRQMMEYDAAELEYWTMDECVKLRKSKVNQLNATDKNNNEEDNPNSISSDSWSSTSQSEHSSSGNTSENSSKRSSAILSGTNFTRDFYRLVKYESNKSLASSSCKSQTGDNWESFRTEGNSIDREEALQNVLKFIAEQQEYCASRRVHDQDIKIEEIQCKNEEQIKGKEDNHIFYTNLFTSCDNCFDKIEGPLASHWPLRNICDKCYESEVECLPEEVIMREPSQSQRWSYKYAQRISLDTVPEEQEDLMSVNSDSNKQLEETRSKKEFIDRIIALHESSTSKEMIEQLNRIIKKGDDEPSRNNNCDLDDSCACATGWVHVEQDIDFADPKARANLLDVMLASSSSSSEHSSRCNSDSEEDNKQYTHLHKLHRFRRQKRASASRQPMGVLRFSANIRPSIIGRNNFYVRYGDKEREAVASFDFLEDISTSTSSEPSEDNNSNNVNNNNDNNGNKIANHLVT